MKPWSALTFAYKQLFTHARAQKIQDNLTAFAEGSTGAPQLETAGITDANVTYAKFESSIYGYIMVMTIIFE
jgi:hypothetical protein